MDGPVREARMHILEEVIGAGVLNDRLIIAQYQRMSHYGLAGFGTDAVSCANNSIGSGGAHTCTGIRRVVDGVYSLPVHSEWPRKR